MEEEKILEMLQPEETETPEPEQEEIPAAEAAEEISVEETPVEETPAETAPETPAAPPAPKKPLPRRRPWPLKILLGLIAFCLCIVMFVVTLAGALVMDLRVMTSEGGIKEIITQLILPAGPSASQRPAAGMTMTAMGSSGVQSQADVSEGLSSALLDTAWEILQQQFGEDIPIEKEQVSQFLEQSTVSDFLAEKVSGVVDDLLSGTNTTTITREEIMGLVRENKDLLEETFDVTIEDTVLEKMEEALEEVEIFDEIEEKGFVNIVTDSLTGGEGADGEASDSIAQLREIMGYVNLLTSDVTIAAFIGAFVILFLLVLLVNFTLPKTLADTGVVLTLAGLILSAPNLLYSSGVLQMALGNAAELQGVLSILGGFLSAVAVVHYTILLSGLGLILLAIVAKLLKNARLKKRMAAYAA